MNLKAALKAFVKGIAGFFMQTKPFPDIVKTEYEKQHGANSLWFSGRKCRLPDESDEAFIARRYAENLTGMFAALDARKRGQQYQKNVRWSLARVGLAFGVALTLILSYGALEGIMANALVFLSMAAIFFAASNWNHASLVASLVRDGASSTNVREAAKQLGETLVRVSAADAPDDLKDLYRLPFIDTSGRPLSERVIETDLTEDYYLDDLFETAQKTRSKMLLWLMGGIIAGVIGVSSAAAAYTWATFEPENVMQATGATFNVDMGFLATAASVTLLLTLLMGVAGVFWLQGAGNRSRINRRLRNIEALTEKSVDQLAVQAGVTGALVQDDEAREAQIRNAKADTTPFFRLGESSGFLRQRYDNFAPATAGLPFGLTFNDLSTHLIVLGGTGSGKTSGTIRPLVKQWLDNDKGGMLVLDGKGMLPAEISSEGYRLITPTTETINPIEGLSPDDVAETLANLAGENEGNGNGDPYWTNAAAKLVRSAAHVAKVLADHATGTYNLATVYELISSQDAQEKARGTITDDILDQLPGASARGVRYALVEFPRLPEKQRGSIEGIAGLWLSQITDNEKLANWADSDTGYEIEAVTSGTRVGVLLPESTYGKAGVLVSGLLKKRVYEAIKRRGDTWSQVEGQTPVLVVIDEVQEMLTDDEVNMLPIARSLGLYAAFSTQNVDGILNKLGDHAGYQLLGNLRSLVAYQTQTEKTVAYISERLGSSHRPAIQQAPRYEDLSARLKKTAQTGAAADAAGRFQQGVGASIRTAGLRTADLAGDVLNFVLHPETRYHITESASEGTEFFKEAIANNMALSNAENFDSWGQYDQTLSLTRNVEADEVNEALSVPNTAFAQVIRGRVVRRDLIQTTPIYDMQEA